MDVLQYGNAESSVVLVQPADGRDLAFLTDSASGTVKRL